MGWQEYDYTSRRHKSSKKIFYRPLIDVEVSTAGEPEEFTALIDSGSEVTIMSTQVAQLLGINTSGKERVHINSYGASNPGFIAEVRMKIPEFPEESIVSNVIFSGDVSDGVPYDILLGQDDFFRKFLVRFEKDKNKFYLALPE